jgi:hypothetical protein
MSQSFRAVKEIWSVHSSCFIEAEKLIVLLHDLAARVGTTSDERKTGISRLSGLKTAGRFWTIWNQSKCQRRHTVDGIEADSPSLGRNDDPIPAPQQCSGMVSVGSSLWGKPIVGLIRRANASITIDALLGQR